jgi:hypothetical protein
MALAVCSTRQQLRKACCILLPLQQCNLELNELTSLCIEKQLKNMSLPMSHPIMYIVMTTLVQTITPAGQQQLHLVQPLWCRPVC